MASVTPSIEPTSPPGQTNTIVTIAGVIAALYFGSEILIPLALAILLSFAMAPAVKLLHKLGLGRGLPVALTVLFTFALLAGLAALIAMQVRELSSDLPRYEATMVRKIETLHRLSNSGVLARVEEAISRVTKAVDHSNQTKAAPPEPGPQGAAEAANGSVAAPVKPPLPVQVVPEAMNPMQAVMLVVAPLLHPLSIAFIVLIFVIFILMQREDLRNRAIRLFGASDLQRTTAAINDGAKRLSRYLLTQLAVNTGAGAVVGIGLWLIGVPSPILLGILFGCARFVPYIGPVIGAALPLLLATAVDPGWSMVVWAAAVIGGIEMIVGQFIEPYAYGHNTGLSPVAIIIAATFWTVLWGPVGLLLSTPLTVCLVVLGRHVERLAFLDVLLGDRPPLSPAETFYQRLLANDPVEVADQAQQCLAEMSIARYYDGVALPGLLMAQDDATQGRLDLARQDRIKASALEVVDDLDHAGDESAEATGLFHLGGKPADAKEPSIDDLMPERVPDHLRPPGSVLCIGARGPLDDAAATMLAQVFQSHGIGARAESFTALSKAGLPSLETASARLIVLSSLDGSSPAFLRFVLRRLRRHAPGVEIVVGAWWRRDGYRETDEAIDEAIRQPKVATFLDAVRFCFAEGDAKPEPAAAPAEALAAVS